MLLFTNKTHSLLHISFLWHFSIQAHSAQQEQLNLSVLSVVLVRKGSIGNIPYVLNTGAVSILCRADKTTFISSLCLFKHQKKLQKASSQRLNFQVRLWSRALQKCSKMLVSTGFSSVVVASCQWQELCPSQRIHTKKNE